MLAVMCLTVVVVAADSFIVNLLLPTLAKDLQASASQLQWIVDAYTIVFACLLLPFGDLADRLGRRRVYTFGMLWFTAASVGAAFSTSAEMLIVCRALMGFGAAAAFPATLAIIADGFPDAKERHKAISVWAAAYGLAIAVGPVIGGWLLETFWWGSVFFVNIVICPLAVIGTWIVARESKDTNARHVDVVGVLLSITAIGMLVFSIIEAPTAGWGSSRTIAGFGISLVLLVGFVLYERRQSEPMFDVLLFKNTKFAWAVIALSVAYFAAFAFVFLGSQFLQYVKDYGILGSGIRLLPAAIGTAVGATVIGRRSSTTVALITAGVIDTMGLALAATFTPSTEYLLIAVSMFLVGVGGGIFSATSTSAVMAALPEGKEGVGSATNDAARQVSGAFGVAVAGSVAATIFSDKIHAGFVGLPAPQEAVDKAAENVVAAHVVADRAAQVFGEPGRQKVLDIARDAYSSGFRSAIGVVAVVTGVFTVAYVLRTIGAKRSASEPELVEPEEAPETA